MTGAPAWPAPDALLEAVLRCLDEHRALDVVTIDLRGKSPMADYMVVATGASSRQVAALAERLLARLKALGVAGIAPEGLKQGDWVLIDAGDAVVHLFRPEIRAFYGLEKMWGAEAAAPQAAAGAGGRPPD